MGSNTVAAATGLGLGLGILLCLILAVAFLRGHGAALLAGLNTMSPEERKRWNVPLLLRWAGLALLVFALLLGVSLAGILLSQHSLIHTGFIASAVVMVALLVFTNSSPRFRK